jgi:predicted RNA polymerase sigma factor
VVPDFVDALDAARADDIGDDLLRLIFTACHPVLPTDARVALTLRLLGGLSTDEIARAFLVPEPPSRSASCAPSARCRRPRAFRGAAGDERQRRLDSVLEVIYLIFNEGYAATAGDDWMRPALCDEALRLGRTLAGLMPDEGRGAGPAGADGTAGLAAAARTDAQGRPVLLPTRTAAAGTGC